MEREREFFSSLFFFLNQNCKQKIDACLLKSLDEVSECPLGATASSSQSAKQKGDKLNIKPSLTGSYLIDEELHQVKEILKN